MLTARPLSVWDAVFCWRLAHVPDVRSTAHDTRRPTVAGHLRWMASWLFKRDRQAWVVWDGDFCDGFGPRDGFSSAYYDGAPAGLARVQSDGTVSIEVLPNYRSRGVGLFGVQVATRFAIGQGWATPTAYIRADNGPSIGLFAKAGYEMTGARNGWVTMQVPA